MPGKTLGEMRNMQESTCNAETRASGCFPGVLALLLFIAAFCFMSFAGDILEGSSIGQPDENLFLADVLLMAVLAMTGVALWRSARNASPEAPSKIMSMIERVGMSVLRILLLLFVLWVVLSNTILITNSVPYHNVEFRYHTGLLFAAYILAMGLLGMAIASWGVSSSPVIYSAFAVGMLLSVWCYKAAFAVSRFASMTSGQSGEPVRPVAQLYCAVVTIILIAYCISASSIRRDFPSSASPAAPRPASRRWKVAFLLLGAMSVLHFAVPVGLQELQPRGDIAWRVPHMPWETAGLACLVQVSAAIAGICYARKNALRTLVAGFLSSGSLFCSALISVEFASFARVPELTGMPVPIRIQDIPAVAAALKTAAPSQSLLIWTIIATMTIGVVSLPILFNSLIINRPGEENASLDEPGARDLQEPGEA